MKRQFILDDDKGEAFVQQCIDNSRYFSDLCEFPEWIDLKYSNPSGKESSEAQKKQMDTLDNIANDIASQLE